MIGDEEKLFKGAIERQSGAVLSLPVDGELKHFKSAFLSETEEGILMQGAIDQADILQALIEDPRDCAVLFKSGAFKLAFTSQVIKTVEQETPDGEDAVPDAILLAVPQRIKTMERRANFRVLVPPGYDLKVRLWLIAGRAYLKDVPPRNQEIPCEVTNIGVGGIGVNLGGKTPQPPQITIEDRIRLQIISGDKNLLLEGKMRPPNPDSSGPTLTTGVAFRRIEDDMMERQNISQLNKIVGDIQREQIKQLRGAQELPPPEKAA